ncbi:MarR family winged helix-turn-helix transcriptional regulator [Streptomyces sp. NPDC021093]|uniref:MarR family winged helix-turn-helix transcriptional regulator n=1 Tax=Streptomyces sp. NPDC021093 TaxID=3365112 RepID=UPI0037914807
MGAEDADVRDAAVRDADVRDAVVRDADAQGTYVPDAQVRDLVVSLHRLMRSLRRAAPAGRLQPTQVIALSLLYEKSPARIGELAARVPCSQPTATAAIAALEARGLVRREPDPSDGRASSVRLTARGAEALSEVAIAEAEALAARLGTLDPEQARAVVSLAPLLRRLAEADDA